MHCNNTAAAPDANKPAYWKTFGAIGFSLLIGLPVAQGNDSLSVLADAGDNVGAAAVAVRELQSRADVKLLDALAAMKGQSAVAKNWYLALAQSIADRDPEKSRMELAEFLPELDGDSAARYWAFTYLTQGDKPRREALLETMLLDPSLDLRYEAIEQRLGRLEDTADATDSQLIASYQALLEAARLPSQVQLVAKKLEELGQEVDLLKHFGFLDQWQVIGPFDNVDQASFDVVYGPEEDYSENKLDFAKSYPGKSGMASWRRVKTDAPDGSVDLNPLYDSAKWAIAYAAGDFVSSRDLECEVRLGSKNACKLWINGQLVINREIYHAGGQIDQYVAPIELKAGKNSILIKVCQNEKKQPWEQDWQFQLRFTDSTGLAIQPAD